MKSAFVVVDASFFAFLNTCSTRWSKYEEDVEKKKALVIRRKAKAHRKPNKKKARSNSAESSDSSSDLEDYITELQYSWVSDVRNRMPVKAFSMVTDVTEIYPEKKTLISKLVEEGILVPPSGVGVGGCGAGSGKGAPYQNVRNVDGKFQPVYKALYTNVVTAVWRANTK
jgi:hypothetical protein